MFQIIVPGGLPEDFQSSYRQRQEVKGAVGNSGASFVSTTRKTSSDITQAISEYIVRLSDQETLPPRSRPKRRKNTVHTRVIDPPMSMRLSLARKSELSWCGRWSEIETKMIASRVMGTCTRNALRRDTKFKHGLVSRNKLTSAIRNYLQGTRQAEHRFLIKILGNSASKRIEYTRGARLENNVDNSWWKSFNDGVLQKDTARLPCHVPRDRS